ncbi:MAG TPA: prepilin-type N-terminal cleavage/methylation domain-containing protein [Candidatus Saccharimonadales bacterium]
MKRLKLNQKGDTIVEVLIAMVILAFVLTGAYQSAQYSLNNIINAKNRITAIDIASGQIESLKAILGSNPSTIGTSSAFYLSNGSYHTISSTLPYNGIFMYEFVPPVKNLQVGDYTFTVYIYWLGQNNLVNHVCNYQNTVNCSDVSLSYRAGI